MPTIKTTLVLDGEREFKAAIRDINGGLGVLDSELKKTEAEFRGNEKSVEALTKKNDVLERSLLTQKDKVETLRAAHEKAAQTYGESDRRTQSWAKQLNNAEAQLYKTEHAIKDNDEALKGNNEVTLKASELAQKLSGKFGVDLPDGVKSSIDSVVSFDASTALMIGTVAAAVVAVYKLEKAMIDLTVEQAAAADEVLTSSVKYGVSAEQIQKLNYAQELLDVSTSTILSSQTKLTRTMSDARDGNAELIEAYKTLGVAVADGNGKLRDSETVFWETIDALGKVANATERDALSLQIMGRSAMDLNPLIVAGSDAFRSLSDEAEKNSMILSDKELAALGAVDDAMQRYNSTIEAAQNNMAVRFAPATEKVYGALGDLAMAGSEFLVESGLIDILAVLLDMFVSILQVLTPTIELLAPITGDLLDPLILGLSLLADALSIIVNLLAVIIESIKWLVTFGKSGFNTQYLSNIGNTFTNGATANYFRNRGYATGTDFALGGTYRVGEEGPETVFLPRGTRVRNATLTALADRTSGGDTFVFQINASNIREVNDLYRIAENERMSTRQGKVRR